jgi:hypothetical protein
VRDEPQPEGRAIARVLVDRGSAGLSDDGAVLVGHRARDPGDVVVGDEAPQRSHEPAAPAPCDALAAAIARERDRPPVRDDDQLPAARHV